MNHAGLLKLARKARAKNLGTKRRLFLLQRFSPGRLVPSELALKMEVEEIFAPDFSLLRFPLLAISVDPPILVALHNDDDGLSFPPLAQEPDK